MEHAADITGLAFVVLTALVCGMVMAHFRQPALVGYLISSLFLHGHFQRPLWLLFALAAASYSLSQRRDEAPAAALRSPGTVTTAQPPLET